MPYSRPPSSARRKFGSVPVTNPGKTIAYTRVSADFCAIFEANLSENPDGTVTVTWVETLSALTERGNAVVAEAESMKEHFFDIFDSLDHFIQTGELAD